MSGQSIHFGTVDLSNCDREPIHIPGSVQPHGALLTLDPNDLSIVQAGGDTLGIFGATAITVLATPTSEILPPDQQQRLRALLRTGRSMVRPVFAFTRTADNGGMSDVVAHVADGLLVLEYEPRRSPLLEDAMALVQGMVRNVQQSASLQACLDAIAVEVRDQTGFDRVLVYQFAPNGSGAVVAEARGDGIDSFLGLNFPASDIPVQARELYLKNWIRCIPDARYAPSPIIPPLNPLNGKPIDLSHSVLRSVSPIHCQYLSNMGVVASMSLSLVLRGRLWGLIACHHNAPRYLLHRLRDACALFAEMASSHLEMKLTETDLETQLHITRVHEELVARMHQESSLADSLTKFRPNLLDFVPAGGVGLWIEGRFSAIGATPTAGQVKSLVRWLNATEKDGVFHTDCLPSIYPPARDFPESASGLLALSLSKTPRDYLLWFRPEISKLVSWAGNPAKPVEIRDNDAEALTPRHSFAVWQEAVRLHAHPWSPIELDAAHRLRLSLLEVVLQRIDQAARKREVVSRHQARLAKQLDRRLEEWRTTAEELKRESERRAVLEAELSQVLRRTVSDQEAERLRIARELHDTLGQSLTLLQLDLEGLGTAAAGSTDFHQRLATVKGMAAELGRDLNRLAWEIRPTALDDLGIQTAIRNLLETWSERSGIPFDLHISLGDERLPSEIETTLYRVLQEALTNVVRHAAATRVDVVLGATNRLITMIIEDNGLGFREDPSGPDLLPSKRLGLLGVRERLTLVNGSLEVESTPGSGTTLFVRIPLGPA